MRELRRRNKNTNYSSESLIPIPGSQLYTEIKIRDKKRYKDELDLLNDKYMETASNVQLTNVNEEDKNDEALRSVIDDQNVNFFYEVSKILILLNFVFIFLKNGIKYLRLKKSFEIKILKVLVNFFF